MVLAGGPLRACPAMLLVRSRRVGALAGPLGVSGAVGGPLLGLDTLDRRADPLPVGPLGWVVGFGAKGAVQVGDLVAAAVVPDLGGGLAPGPPTPNRRWHWTQRLEDIAGALLLDG
jgi:hypothetical protein